MKVVMGRRMLLMTGLALLSGCVSLEQLGGVIGGGGTVTGEVRSIDRSRIQVRQDYGGDQSLRYDSRTRVVENGREARVSSLRRGDRVWISVDRDANGTVWADRIEVRDGRDGRGREDRDRRDGRDSRVQRIDGQVVSVDARRGVFRMQWQRRQVSVYARDRLSSADARRLERLRRGDRVRVEVRGLNGSTAELVRFR